MKINQRANICTGKRMQATTRACLLLSTRELSMLRNAQARGSSFVSIGPWQNQSMHHCKPQTQENHKPYDV